MPTINFKNATGSFTYEENTTPPDPGPIDPPPINPPVEGGGDWTPPSYLRTDTRPEQVPDIAKPDYLTPFTDPVFRSKIIRITGDPGTTMLSGVKWPNVARHHYSSDQAWNVDQSMIYLDQPGVLLDGENYQPLCMINGIPSDSDVRWHATDPAWMIYAAGSKYGGWNPKTGEVRVIKNFGSSYSSLKFGPWEGSPSEDGDMVVLTDNGVAFAYKISTDKKYPDINKDFDNARISPLGNYIIFGTSPDHVIVTDLQGKTVTDLPNNYVSHFDVIVDEDGEECVVGRANGAAAAGPSGIINKYRMRDGKRTSISTLGWSYHTSTRALKTHKWAVSGSADEGGSNQPGEGELFLSNLDGSACYRLCHHHIPRSVDYDGQTQASHSPDGGRVIFASAWGGSGAAPRPVGCYVCDIRT